MAIFIKKNPDVNTLIAVANSEVCPSGYEHSTEKEAAEWVEAQLAAGWKPEAKDNFTDEDFV